MAIKKDRLPRSFGEPPTRPGETRELTQDEIFHILQTNRRRDVIVYLLEKNEPVKMGDIAEIIAADEHETTVAELTSTQRQRVYIPLYQTHLPKLDEKGVIAYNKSRGIVRPAEGLETFRRYLEAVDSCDGFARPETDSGRSRLTTSADDYCITAMAISVSLLVASAVDLLAIPGTTLATIVTALFVLATIAPSLSDSLAATDDETSSTTLTYRK